jgi:flavorubredoxin
METRIDEVADGIFRLSSWVPKVTAEGFTFNQFLIRAEQPMLFHCGHRAMFAQISQAVAKLIPVERLRWIGFSHLEADESGAMNLWLEAAPQAELAHGAIGCMTSLTDLADRPPRLLADGEVLDLGGKRVRHIDTPHLPHGWDARLLFEDTTATLLCSDLFAHTGNPPSVTEGDIVGPALAMERLVRAISVTPATRAQLGRLADLEPRTLALMHGASFRGDTRAALRDLAAGLASLAAEAPAAAD